MPVRLLILMMMSFILMGISVKSVAEGNTIKPGILEVGAQENVSCAVDQFFRDIGKQETLTVEFIKTPLEKASKGMQEKRFYISAHGISNINLYAPLNIALPSDPHLSVTRGFTVLRVSKYAREGFLSKGARVAVMDKSTALEDIRKHYPEHHFDLVMVSQLEGDARGMLRAGTVDAIAEGYTGFWFNPDDAKDLVMIDVHPLDGDKPTAEALVFWVDKSAPELLKRINQHLKKAGGNIYRYYQENGRCSTHYAFPDNN